MLDYNNLIDHAIYFNSSSQHFNNTVCDTIWSVIEHFSDLATADNTTGALWAWTMSDKHHQATTVFGVLGEFVQSILLGVDNTHRYQLTVYFLLTDIRSARSSPVPTDRQGLVNTRVNDNTADLQALGIAGQSVCMSRAHMRKQHTGFDSHHITSFFSRRKIISSWSARPKI